MIEDWTGGNERGGKPQRSLEFEGEEHGGGFGLGDCGLTRWVGLDCGVGTKDGVVLGRRWDRERRERKVLG